MSLVIQSLFGVMIAGCVFAALLWSGYRSYTATGGLRIAHIGLVVLTLGGLTALTIKAVALSNVAGLLLAGFSIAAVFLERGWSRIIPGMLLIFASALIAGLPYAGN